MGSILEMRRRGGLSGHANRLAVGDAHGVNRP